MGELQLKQIKSAHYKQNMFAGLEVISFPFYMDREWAHH